MSDSLQEKLADASKAGDAGKIEALLAAGADVNGGGSALYLAAWYGQAEAVKCLIAHGGNVNMVHENGFVPLHAAAYQGHAAIIDLLLAHGANSTVRCQKNKTTAEEYARDAGRNDIATRLSFAAAEAAAGPDEVVLHRELPGSRVLQEVYNFAARERVSLVRQSATGVVEALLREGFDDLAGQDALQSAFDTYARRGGRIGMDAIRRNDLRKPVLKPGSPA